MTRTLRFSLAALALAALVALPAAAATERPAKRQRIAFDIRLPLQSGSGTFRLVGMTPGAVKTDSGVMTFTSGPAPVFSGRLVGGQLVDRFRATATLAGKHGDLTIRMRADFASASRGYQAGTGTWSIVGGTRAYERLTGGGRMALVRPPTPPGKYGFARHEGFVRA